MPSPLVILQHTPWWVGLIFALLIWASLRGLRPRRTPWWRLILVPLVFALWGFANLLLGVRADPVRAAIWFALAVPGFFLARWVWRRVPVTFEPGGIAVTPGSIVPLVRNVGIFVAKYALGATQGYAAAVGATELLARVHLWDGALSGLLAGYFASRMASLIRAFLAARQRA